MKKMILTIALVFGFSCPMTVNPAFAEEWYRVNNPGWHVDLFGNGQLRCRIPHGEYLKSGLVTSSKKENRPPGHFAIYVYWQKRLGTMEWHWKSAHNNWCPHWNRNGWVDSSRIQRIDKPGGAWIN